MEYWLNKNDTKDAVPIVIIKSCVIGNINIKVIQNEKHFLHILIGKNKISHSMTTHNEKKNTAE